MKNFPTRDGCNGAVWSRYPFQYICDGYFSVAFLTMRRAGGFTSSLACSVSWYFQNMLCEYSLKRFLRGRHEWQFADRAPPQLSVIYRVRQFCLRHSYTLPVTIASPCPAFFKLHRSGDNLRFERIRAKTWSISSYVDSCLIRESGKPLLLRPQVHRTHQLKRFDARHTPYNDKESCHSGAYRKGGGITMSPLLAQGVSDRWRVTRRAVIYAQLRVSRPHPLRVLFATF